MTYLLELLEPERKVKQKICFGCKQLVQRKAQQKNVFGKIDIVFWCKKYDRYVRELYRDGCVVIELDIESKSLGGVI